MPAAEAAAYRGRRWTAGDDDAGAEGDRRHVRAGADRPATPSRSRSAVAAVSDALDGRTLSRDDLHEALRAAAARTRCCRGVRAARATTPNAGC